MLQFLSDFMRRTGVNADEAFLAGIRKHCDDIIRLCGSGSAAKAISHDCMSDNDDQPDTAICE